MKEKTFRVPLDVTFRVEVTVRARGRRDASDKAKEVVRPLVATVHHVERRPFSIVAREGEILTEESS